MQTSTHVAYVIVPRRRHYWLEAVHHGGMRHVIDSFREEAAAVLRLRELQGEQEAIERRCCERDISGWQEGWAVG